MGVIQRQGFKQSIISYVAVLVGACSVVLIYPLIDAEKLGILQFTINTALLFAPFASFGMTAAATRFFPEFKDADNKHNGFLFLISAVAFLSAVIFLVPIYLFRNSFAHFFGKDASVFLTTLPYILVFSIVNVYIILFMVYASLFNRIVVPSILQNLLPKITQPIFVLLCWYGIFSFKSILDATGVVLIITLLGMIIYVYGLKQFFFKPQWKKYSREKVFRILQYSGFSVLIATGSLLSSRIDQFFIVPILSFSALAIFNFGMFISEALDVPRKAITSIANPLISEAMNKKDYPAVLVIYKKSCDVLLAVGVLLFILVILNMDSLFNLMLKNGEVYRTGKNVIVLLCLSRLIDMGTGVNGEIIAYSHLFRYNLYTLSFLATLTIFLNWLLVPRIGITGSALATCLSMLFFNVWRVALVWRNFKLYPFHLGMFKVMVLGVVCFFVGNLIPTTHHSLVDIFLRSAVVCSAYGVCVIYFNLSEDATELYQGIRNKN